ncbi:hypothetical protein [Bradyrhizobium sp. USDA 4472]
MGGAANAADTLAPVGQTFCDPYKKYSCLDSYLGSDFFTRFINYYRLEWNHDSAPADPKAPPSRRAEWPATPQSTPPMPFTEWPYGGTTNLGVTRPSSVDSPLMSAPFQHDTRVMDERRPYPGLWLDRSGRKPQQQHRPWRQCPCRL